MSDKNPPSDETAPIAGRARRPGPPRARRPRRHPTRPPRRPPRPTPLRTAPAAAVAAPDARRPAAGRGVRRPADRRRARPGREALVARTPPPRHGERRKPHLRRRRPHRRHPRRADHRRHRRCGAIGAAVSDDHDRGERFGHMERGFPGDDSAAGDPIAPTGPASRLPAGASPRSPRRTDDDDADRGASDDESDDSNSDPDPDRRRAGDHSPVAPVRRRTSRATDDAQQAHSKRGHDGRHGVHQARRHAGPRARRRRRGQHRRAAGDGAALRGLGGPDGAHRPQRPSARRPTCGPTRSCST